MSGYREDIIKDVIRFASSNGRADEYTLKVMAEHGGNVKIYIGTDSQNLRRKIVTVQQFVIIMIQVMEPKRVCILFIIKKR